MVNGATYAVKVRAFDGTDYSKVYSGSTTFTVDTTKPTVGLTSTAFVEGTWRAERPADNTFTFDGPNDTKSFAYSADGSPLPPKAADSNGNATFNWIPGAGSHKLSVTPTDQAGNVGQTSTFSFGVGGASFAAPSGLARSTDSFAIKVTAPPNAISADLSWRFAGQGDGGWADALETTTGSGVEWNGEVAADSASGSSTTPPLMWDASSEEASDTEGGTIAAPALIEIRSCFEYATSPTQVCTVPKQVQLLPSAFESNFPVIPAGPLDVALFSGEAQFADTDAVDAAGAIGRTFSSYDWATQGIDGPFGVGWTADLQTVGDSDLELIDNRAKDTTLVLAGGGFGTQAFVPTPDDQLTFLPAGTDDGSRIALSNSGQKATLTRLSGAVTTWILVDGDWEPESALAIDDDPAVSGDEAAATSFEYSRAGYPTWLSRTPPGSTATCTSTTQDPGCRGLRLSYDESGSHVTAIEEVGHGAPDSVVATYTYDDNGRLATACGIDPAPSATGPGNDPLCAAYTYQVVDGRTVLSSVTPPGQATWRFGYDDEGRLTTVRRAMDVDTNGSTSDAVWTVDYDVALSTAELDLSVAATSQWGQTRSPAHAYAVYGPDATVGSVRTAQLLFADDGGAVTNMAVYGAGRWLVDSYWYDESGAITQVLNAAGRERALAAAPEDRVSVALEASSLRLYNPSDGRLEDEFAPTRSATLRDGTVGRFRHHTSYLYDDEPGSEGLSPGRPVGEDTPMLVQVTESASTSDMTSDMDARRTRYEYSPNVAGDGDGWQLGMPTRVLREDGTGGWATTVERFNKLGQTIETRGPGAASSNGAGTDAASTFSRYFSPSSEDSECNTTTLGRPELKSILCKTGQVAGVAGQAPMITYYASFDGHFQPTLVLERRGGTVVRRTETEYDALGRPTSSHVLIPGKPDTLPLVRMGYDARTGLPTTRTVGSESISVEYDSWGRTRGYSDASGLRSTFAYNPASRLTSFSDGVGSYSYTYGGGAVEDHRGMASKVAVSLDGGGSAAFDLSYDPQGQPSSVRYPNGTIATSEYDEVGNQIGLSYADSTGLSILNFTREYDVTGRVVSALSTASSQSYQYDALGRLSVVDDSQDGSCTTRMYEFNSSSQRVATRTFGPGSDGSCQHSTATSTRNFAYDAADRIVGSGYSYDELDRTLTMPGADTSTPGAGATTIDYFANDMAKSVSQVSGSGAGAVTSTSTYELDPSSRVQLTTESVAGSETRRSLYRYSGETDAPSSVRTSNDRGATWRTTRYVSIDPLGLAATIEDGGLTYNLADMAGNLVGTQVGAQPSIGLSAYQEFDEYGNETASALPRTRYGWLGAHQRSGDSQAGFVLMGARLYNSTTGRFLSRDPIQGGNETSFTYPQDPINRMDLTGLDSGSDGSASGVFKACDEYFSKAFCTKIGWWTRKIVNMANDLDVNDNQRNAARHFAWVVVLYSATGNGEATRKMLRAHEAGSKSVDSERDRKNNRFSLNYFEHHWESIYEHFGDDGIGEDDVKWLLKRALRLYRKGKMFKMCPWGGSDKPVVVKSNDFHCA